MNGPNGFWVTGTVVRDAYQGPTFSYATVREGEKQYWDIACYEDGPMDSFRGLAGGNEVRVRGHLGKRKIKDTDRNARPRYEVQLIADSIEVRQGVAPAPATATAPARQAPPRQQQFWEQASQPAQPSYPVPNPGWPDPQRPNAPTHVRAYQNPVQNPAQFDAADDLPDFGDPTNGR